MITYQNIFKNINKRTAGKSTRLFFILLLFQWISFTCFGQTNNEFNNELRDAYQKTLKLKIQEARVKLLSMDSASKQLATFYYVENLADILELLISEDIILFNKLVDKEEIRLDQVNRLSDQNPYKLFCQVEIKMQWAFVKLKYGEELSAVWNLRQAYKLISKNREKFPGFLPNYKSIGLLHIVFGSVPEKYHWVLDFLGISGSINEGLEELNLLAENSEEFKTEAILMGVLADAFILQNAEKATEKIVPMVKNIPDNLLVKYLYILVLLKNAESEKALQVIGTTDNLVRGYLPLHMLHYLKGEALLHKAAYEDASKSFATFLLNYKGQNFIKDANFKLFLCHWLNDEDLLASQYYEKAKQTGRTITEADKYADKLLSRDEYPNKLLMKVRLYTDGGYYEEAVKLLQSLHPTDFQLEKDRVEFVYRRARLYHKQKQIKAAVDSYKQVIENSGKNRWYFAPNSALQLGYIYIETGKPELARAYFEKATGYKGHEYKNSIDNKANSALSRLKSNE